MAQIQYTIRNIPPPLDKVIRKRASQTGQSFNQTVVDLLALQTFGTTDLPTDDCFDWLFAQASPDPAYDQAIEDLSRIDDKLWQ